MSSNIGKGEVEEKNHPKFYNPMKQKNIYDHRRRRSASNYIEKLKKAVEVSNKKDVNLMRSELDELIFSIYDKLGYFDSLKGIEKRKDPLQRRLQKGARIADPVGKYICPVCKKIGFLFSPNMDERKIDLYMFHILWEEKEVQMCHIGESKRDRILVLSRPSEGILTLR